MKKEFTLHWLWKYLFPIHAYFVSIWLTIAWPIQKFSEPTLLILLNIVVLFFLTEWATCKYIVTDRELIFIRYFVWATRYNLKELTWLEIPEGLNRLDFLPGFNNTKLHFKNGKELQVTMLPDPKKFIDAINEALKNKNANA